MESPCCMCIPYNFWPMRSSYSLCVCISPLISFCTPCCIKGKQEIKPSKNFLFIYGLINDNINVSDFIVSIGEIL